MYVRVFDCFDSEYEITNVPHNYSIQSPSHTHKQEQLDEEKAKPGSSVDADANADTISDMKQQVTKLKAVNKELTKTARRRDADKRKETRMLADLRKTLEEQVQYKQHITTPFRSTTQHITETTYHSK